MTTAAKNDFDYDLFVIGAGSGGVRAARMSASLGARVAVAEDLYLGGTCVNVGCVPKKLYVYASEFGKGFKDARGFGWQSERPAFDWPTLRDNKVTEISRLNAIYDNLLTSPGVKIVRGRGTVIDPHTVDVDGKRFTAEKILLATGTWPYKPEFPGADLSITSNEVFDLEQFPERMLIIGGGYIATEFAGIFNGLGAEVIQLYRSALFMRGFDDDVREFTASEVRKTGVDLRFNTNVTAIEKTGDKYTVTLTDGSSEVVDTVLCAVGRRPNIDGLGLENTAVTLKDNGFIKVDGDFQTDEPSIYALGDITDGPQLTPLALAEGMAFSYNQFGGEARSVGYEYIPTAVFCQPNIGTVGYTETEARDKFGELDIYKSEFKPMKHTLSGRDERSMMKLIVEKASDRVVGLHMVGPDAGEIVQGMAIAIKMGATKADFDSTIGIHPTAAEEFVTMRTPVG
ncbi:glutathione-disulfide reductase [Luminiphilus syltensis NOR5-1B]|uniref:Glutathione reductase n=1 Tax=Luminiphilus syltensis NOR5-1B TaxID=565045 RepID=B8KTN6_9GAMM|nr:glutathione-disulfide reductase [Luminiphilus syltensis]EED36359.1 glutathione-disulfide reductase [Luminiphilus syltensis NOR5-1B]